MNKILVLGDIHGRLVWHDIIIKEKPDLTIFLGDYVSTHEDISSEQQLSNLEDILSYKEDHIDSVILLRGNHCTQHLGYYWAECSGFDPVVHKYMSTPEFVERFNKLTQWIYINEDLKTVFSHAGVSKVWMKDIAKVNNIYEINNLPPSEIFGFTPSSLFDYSGDSVTQPPTWIRAFALSKCYINDWDQVVGHTPLNKITNLKDVFDIDRNIWMCDTLGVNQYLTIKNNIFTINKYESTSI